MRHYLCLNIYVCIKILISYLGFSQLRLCKPPPPVSHSGSLEKTHILPGTCGTEREIRYRLVTAASVTVNVEHLTHQIHLSFLQLDLLLPQLLAVKQFHTEVLTHNRRIRKRYLINPTFSFEEIHAAFILSEQFYLLVNFLVVWMKAQSPQKQMSGTFR